MSYKCSNCRTFEKLFALRVARIDDLKGVAYKLGEFPPFGPKTPTKLLTLLGDQRRMFLRGRRCETQGLGVGAFSYYRRVVEHQRNRIIEEIIKVAKLVNAPQPTIAHLTDALAETQFSKSVALVKDAIPQSLLLKGHNPLTLLHEALSAGLHEESDARCLELAQAVRVVLAELSERLSQALKDEAELGEALSQLMKARS